MAKTQTEMVRVRLPKTIRAKLEIVAQEKQTDMSKLIRNCIECFIKNNDCLARRKL